MFAVAVVAVAVLEGAEVEVEAVEVECSGWKAGGYWGGGWYGRVGCEGRWSSGGWEVLFERGFAIVRWLEEK